MSTKIFPMIVNGPSLTQDKKRLSELVRETVNANIDHITQQDIAAITLEVMHQLLRAQAKERAKEKKRLELQEIASLDADLKRIKNQLRYLERKASGKLP